MQRSRFRLMILYLAVCSLTCATTDSSGSPSLSERLLTILGDGMYPSKPKDTTTSRSDSIKRIIEFLSSKITNPKSGIPSSALQELNALTSGATKTPKPINLTQDTPEEAIVKYFKELGINDLDCQLRTICELQTEPQASYGVFGELINYVFSNELPSQNMAKLLNEETYSKMYKAAQNGRRLNDCSNLYSSCPKSYKDYIKLVAA
ncbi:hypothetical protein CHUAL_012632 [Chamberlinius hualienensis]